MKQIILKVIYLLTVFATCCCGQFVNAQSVDVSLNLRYSNPADPAFGGVWYLIAQDNDTEEGIAELVVAIKDILNAKPSTDIDLLAFEAINGMTNIGGNSPVVTDNSLTQITYRQDLADASNLVYGVGAGSGTAGNVPGDSVASGVVSPWNNSVLIASGTFGDIRPTFSTTAKVFTASSGIDTSAAASVETVVRGDSVGTDALLLGDANRNWTVDLDDFNAVINNFGSTNGWDQGNFSGAANSTVDLSDFGTVMNFFGSSSIPPGTGLGTGLAVPEPSTFVLLVTLVGFIGLNSKRSQGLFTLS